MIFADAIKTSKTWERLVGDLKRLEPGTLAVFTSDNRPLVIYFLHALKNVLGGTVLESTDPDHPLDVGNAKSAGPATPPDLFLMDVTHLKTTTAHFFNIEASETGAKFILGTKAGLLSSAGKRCSSYIFGIKGKPSFADTIIVRCTKNRYADTWPWAPLVAQEGPARTPEPLALVAQEGPAALDTGETKGDVMAELHHRLQRHGLTMDDWRAMIAVKRFIKASPVSRLSMRIGYDKALKSLVGEDLCDKLAALKMEKDNNGIH